MKGMIAVLALGASLFVAGCAQQEEPVVTVEPVYNEKWDTSE